MPARWRRYDCPCGEPERTVQACAHCGAQGADVGWRMTDEDRDELFRRCTGLHRPAEGDTSPAAQAVRLRLVTCTLCDGAGLIQTHGPKDGWGWCPVCHGLRGGLDGRFTHEPPGRDIAMSIAPRLSSSGYIHRYRRGRSVRRDLDEAELAQFKDWLRDQGFRHRAPIVPAILCRETERIAVGPSYRVMLAPYSAVREAFEDLAQIERGYIELGDGRFRDREAAAWYAVKSMGLPEPHLILLDPESLPYHEDVPCGVVRW